jgi:enterochelin esterase-like enzyme
MPTNLMQQARAGAPLIEDMGAAELRVTFVWKGRAAPQLIGDFNEWGGSDPLAPGAPLELSEREPGVWTSDLTLPRDAYMEYAYVLHGRRMPDPLNPNSVSNGVGDRNNFFYMPDAAPTPLARRARGVPHGTLMRLVLEAGDVLVGERRPIFLYQPAAEGPYPLVVVLDGRDYLRRAGLPNMIDNLIAQGRIRPVALALADSSLTARYLEYACSEATVSFLADHLLPFARQHLHLTDARDGAVAAHAIVGSSMGGVMALYAALRVPEVFGKVISQSGAFQAAGRDFVIFDLVRHGSPRPVDVWMDAGRYEFLLDCNRRMHEALTTRGYNVTYREYNAGHNFPAWRDDLWRGLESLYGIGHNGAR